MNLSTPSVIENMQHPGSWSHIFHPELIVPEAFTNDKFRVPRQVAVALDRPLNDVLSRLGDWQTSSQWSKVLIQLAEDLEISCYVYHGNRLIDFQLRSSHKASLVFSVWSGHVYLYKGAGSYAEEHAKHRTLNPRSGPSTSLVKAERHVPANVDEFMEFPWALAERDLANVPAGRYWVVSDGQALWMNGGGSEDDQSRDIIGALDLFAKSRRYPRVSLARYPSRMDAPARSKPYELTYVKVAGFDHGHGEIVIRSHAVDSGMTATWARRLNVPYAGQSLGPFTGVVLDTLLRKRVRRYLAEDEKQQLLGEQGGQCSLCGDALTTGETVFDHTIPLHEMTADQSLDAFQAICGQCSANKTASEARPRLGMLRSRFTRQLWSCYVRSPLPPCMTYRDADAVDYGVAPKNRNPVIEKHMAVDVVRCRFNALYTAPYLPVFCSLDDMEPVDPGPELPDLIYVDKEATPRTLAEVLALLPYHGPGWYAKPAIEYCLHVKRLTWDDLRWGVRASGRVEGDAIRAALDVMERAWEGISRPNDAPAKRSINTWIGCCGMKDSLAKLRTTVSYDVGDSPPGVTEINQVCGNPGLHMYTRETREIDSGTTRPIYDYCLAVEHTRLAQAYQAVSAVYKIVRQPVPAINLTTDGFIWERPRKKVTAEQVTGLLESITFRQLPKLEEHIRNELHQPEPKQKRLRTEDLYPISGYPSDLPVFRVVTPKVNQHLRGVHRLPVTNWRHPDLESMDLAEDWMDLTEEEAFRMVVEDQQSLLVRGIAGTGKSHFIRQVIIPALEAKGLRVVTIAKTHCAALVAGGDTCDHFAWKHVREGGTGADVIWVDEVSMLDARLLDDLNHASFRDPPIQWILSGDFNQYEPFFSTFCGRQVTKSFNGSHLLREMTGGHRLTMTTCHRSDSFLFDWYASLTSEPEGWRYSRGVATNAAEARATFTEATATGFIPGSNLAPTNLVISHKRRVDINARCNEADRAAHPEAQKLTLKEFKITTTPGTNSPQDAWFWPGMKLVACCKGRKLRNGRAYELTSLGRKDVVVTPLDSDGDPAANEPVKLTRAAFFKSLRLPYAVTYASAQGLTIEGLLALWDTDHSYFDWRKLFVGISWAHGRDKVIVY